MRKFLFERIASICTLCFAFVTGAQAQTYTAFGYFFESNGNAPTSPLVQGTDGMFYGTTRGGGSQNCSDTWQFFTGCGTVFQVGSLATPNIVHAFCSETNCLDGALSVNVIQGVDGNFYGTALFGGSDLTGSFFKIAPSGEFTLLHSFCSAYMHCAYGYVASPNPIIQGRDGNFYGTTLEGGTNNGFACYDEGCGTVFKVTSNGRFATLYNFCALTNCSDGYIPTGALVQATNGNFYGTTGIGLGFENGPCTSAPCGTVFEITPSGKLTTLYSFCSKTKCDDGGSPTGSLVQAANGRLYGTTFNPGTVFEITPSGKFTELYRFCKQAGCPDGQYPTPLTLGTDGNLYGVTQAGGVHTNCSTGGFYAGCGTIFRITPQGNFTTLYNFCSQENCNDGYIPSAALVQGTDGMFYGTTEYGGVGNCVNAYRYGTGCGLVFNLSMGLAPFVESTPGFGKVGSVIGILGNGLTVAKTVSFNGTPAKFKVISDSFLKAQIPSGATTGKIEVTTQSGPLSSNMVFYVVP